MQTLWPLFLSLPRVTPVHFESLMTLFSMIQPLLQWVPISPICSAVGAAHWVAAWLMLKPRTVM